MVVYKIMYDGFYTIHPSQVVIPHISEPSTVGTTFFPHTSDPTNRIGWGPAHIQDAGLSTERTKGETHATVPLHAAIHLG